MADGLNEDLEKIVQELVRETDSSFGCGGTFDCTGGTFGIVVSRA